MTRDVLARILGGLTFGTGVLLMLAGSDLPPPSGFIWVVLIAAVVGLAVSVLIPVALRFRDREGSRRTALTAAAAGFAFGVGVALLLLLGGSGEPSVPEPGPFEAVAFLAVVGLVGAIAATVIVGWAIVADRAKSKPSALIVSVVPGAVVLLGITAVIAGRLAS